MGGERTIQPVAKYLCEFVGTFILTLTVGLNVVPTVLHPLKPDGYPFCVLSIASSLMLMVYAMGPISGGHFNPAVTLACKLCDAGFAWSDAALYMLVQTIASTCAALSYWGIMGSTFNIGPAPGFHGMSACTAELLYTAMLCFVVLQTACSTKAQNREYFGLAIGMVIMAGGSSIGWISGGVLNPAVGIGLDLASIMQGFGWSVAYAAFQFIGAILAAGAFQYLNGAQANSRNQLRNMVSEFIGTFYLVLTVGLCVLGTAGPSAPLAIASCLLSMIYACSVNSGGHLNPAVTIALLASGRNKTNVQDALAYISAQVVAGLCGGLVYGMLAGRAFPLSPQGPHGNHANALILEALFTGILCMMVLSCASTKEPQQHFFGLVIGLAVVVGGYAAGPISGAALNPAIAIAIDTTNAMKGGQWFNCVLWALAEIAGAGVAAGCFRTTHSTEFKAFGGELPQSASA